MPVEPVTTVVVTSPVMLTLTPASAEPFSVTVPLNVNVSGIAVKSAVVQFVLSDAVDRLTGLNV